MAQEQANETGDPVEVDVGGGGEAAIQAMLKADEDIDKEARYREDRELFDKLMWQEMYSDEEDEEA